MKEQLNKLVKLVEEKVESCRVKSSMAWKGEII